jgi:formamidopyrimidine-DNA glycosylase
MPELPEVETTRRGIEPHVLNKKITRIIVHQTQLRFPVPVELQQLQGSRFTRISRRGKYLLLYSPVGSVILHLGMSGSLRIASANTSWKKHDHLAVQFSGQKQLRLHDPRRFGAVLFETHDPLQHPLLTSLGPEPLSDDFTPQYLRQSCRNRKASIKQHIMNSKIVVGVGNIYASEALFLAGIHPAREAGRISANRLAKLVTEIQNVLTAAIRQGGTTLRDFLHENGEPGYFKQSLNVYGRTGEPCKQCGHIIREFRLGQRSTFYCPNCQH